MLKAPHSKEKLRIPSDEEAGTVSTVLTVGSHNETYLIMRSRKRPLSCEREEHVIDLVRKSSSRLVRSALLYCEDMRLGHAGICGSKSGAFTLHVFSRLMLYYFHVTGIDGRLGPSYITSLPGPTRGGLSENVGDSRPISVYVHECIILKMGAWG